MILAEVTLAAPAWLLPAVLLLMAFVALLVWSYRATGWGSLIPTLAAVLKGFAVVVLAVCLVEPLFTGTRPRPGSNLFLVLADNSRSLELSDRETLPSRGAALKQALAEDAPWLTRLSQDFDVRRYVFDTHVRAVKSFSELTFDGESSSLHGALNTLVDRFRGQPVAGILLLTDGNGTDLSDVTLDAARLPPVYPVSIGSDRGLVDLSVAHVSVSQTNFEAAPVTLTATIAGRSVSGHEVAVRVLNEAGEELERRKLAPLPDGEPSVQRFLLKPDKPGVSVFAVQAFIVGEDQLSSGDISAVEVTLANNRRTVTVDRGNGPYRVLYVSGRPNWEFKFLRRALAEDDEVRLVGLVRIAKKEPKFAFLGRSGERTNPLFRGFGNPDEQAEQYDEPVLLRLGTEDANELRSGFPQSAADLFQFQAVILDDIEAAFFTQEQLSLLQRFVSRRGGGLLMLGGDASFGEGGYHRTAVGEMLPVYLDRGDPTATATGHRWLLTREGWLQPWARLRTNEQDEAKRLASMPEFHSLNAVRAIKPGASVLAQVTDREGTVHPALVVQPFGRGRTAALLVGDLWRWNLRRANSADSDLEKSWRQTVRWLISDVPARVEVETRRTSTGILPAVQITVRVRDENYEPLDNAQVTLRVTTPQGQNIDLGIAATDRSPGQYESVFVPRESGIYRAEVSVQSADGAEVGKRELGWSVEPQTEEFRDLTINRALLEQIAQQSGGEMVSRTQLDQFVSRLPNRKIPVTETWTYPLWHQSSVFLLAIMCLIGEWGLRRWRGLP
jgi:uncharacterized membrane protein